MKNKNLINRTVVFVDLENCCGSSQLVRCFHDEVRQHITEEFGTDHVLINYSTGKLSPKRRRQRNFDGVAGRPLRHGSRY